MTVQPTVDPTSITIRGRLSYPVFSYAEAVARNAKSPTPNADPSKVTPEFHVLLNQRWHDKFVTFVLDTFLPYCVAQSKAGEKRNPLTQAEADRLVKLIESEDWDAQPPYIAIKSVGEKTKELAPEAVSAIKVKGNRGVDIEERAVVQDEDELVRPNSGIIKFPAVRPIKETVHNIYPGCEVAVTLNVYSFLSGKLPGFSASSGVVVFRADDERFGGGMAIDEDAIMADD